MNIMTIDPGLNKTGLFIKGEGVTQSELIDNRKLSTEKDKYNNLFLQIAKYIKLYDIDVVFIEDYPFGMKASRQLFTSEIKGVIKSSIYGFNKDIKIFYIQNTLWKSYIDKTVTSKKKKVKEYKQAILDRYGWNFKTEDQADAYLMMIALTMIQKGAVKTESANKIYKIMQEEKICIQ